MVSAICSFKGPSPRGLGAQNSGLGWWDLPPRDNLGVCGVWRNGGGPHDGVFSSPEAVHVLEGKEEQCSARVTVGVGFRSP